MTESLAGSNESFCLDSLSVVWANEQLRFGIALLHGEAVREDFLGAVFLASYLARRLHLLGYAWQAGILRSWIHKAVKTDSFLSRRAKRGDRAPRCEEASK